MNTETSQGNDFNDFQVDLTNCDREPIHIPGAVQSHGVLLALGDDLEIVQISENCAELFGVSAPELLGRPLSALLSDEDLDYLETEIFPQDLEAAPVYLNKLTVKTNGRGFEPLAHRYEGVLILEFEMDSADAMKSGHNLYGALRTKLAEINRTVSVRDFCQKAAQAVRSFTGFDRVMIYQFLEDDSGHVLAEALDEGMDPFLDLHYPASDIPVQARALYLKQLLRFKFDVGETPARVVPALNPQTNRPLDMSYAATRSMSPIHVEYLKNMGVAASMSISIVKDDKLWGLIACHHNSPRYIPHAARMICEFLAHTVSLQIGAKDDAENHGYLSRLKDANNAIINELSESPELGRVLIEGENNLLTTVRADGAAIVIDDEVHLMGVTPDENQVRRLVEWLWKNQSEEVYATGQLSKNFPRAEGYIREASGILAARLTKQAPEYLIWFRGEHAHTVSWAGNPDKPAAAGAFGERLTPRKSFAAWQTEVRGQSKPWKEFEIEFAATLRRSIVDVILRRVEELRKLNRELESSNSELDSFAYIASHDLKEPLRGIHNYSNFLIEDYGGQLDEEANSRLSTLVHLTDRMENLLDSLLHYSRVGRTDLRRREIDLQAVLQDSLAFVRTRIEENNVEIKIARELPRAFADAVRVGEIFTNLISNAIKYNDKEKIEIEIGWLENVVRNNIAGEKRTEQLFYVRDNGIGIDEKHHGNIFRIFKRLHARNAYGGGTGAGLTIVKKIVERHEGRIWLESKPGEGTSFYFTLG